MTRINVVPPEELSDQHLLAEYHELPRCIKQNINIDDEVPAHYILGKGHMKWAKMHSLWLTYRYEQLIREMKYRGFNPNYTTLMLQDYWINEQHLSGNLWYHVTIPDIMLNRGRLIYKYSQRPSFYKWTNREKPDYYPSLTIN